jgi:hypothetical protein
MRVKIYTDTLAYRLARYVHIIESNSSTIMRDTNLAESHTTWKDGEWVEMRLHFEPSEENSVPSGLQPSDVFKDVLNPDWDELCKLPPGESAVIDAEVVDPWTLAKTPSGHKWTGKKRKGASAEEKPAKKGKKGKKSKKSKKKAKKSEYEEEMDEDEMEEESEEEMEDDDDDDEEERLPTPPPTTRPRRSAASAAAKVMSKYTWDKDEDADFGL